MEWSSNSEKDRGLLLAEFTLIGNKTHTVYKIRDHTAVTKSEISI
jgi:hypothetical protein